MRLHEEYIRRHQLDIPIICFDSRSNLFLKTKGLVNPHWNIFNITFRQQTSRPGFYEFSRIEPIYNGEGAFKSFDKDYYVHWDKYEQEITNVVNNYRKFEYYAVAKNERTLVAWEMFLFMFDRWLAERMNAEFYKLVSTSITPDLDNKERTIAYMEASRMLPRCSDSDNVLDMLNNRIMPMAKGHSQWLEDLVNA